MPLVQVGASLRRPAPGPLWLRISVSWTMSCPATCRRFVMQVPERSTTSTLAGSLRLAAQGGLRARAQPTSAQQGSQMETTTPIRPPRQQQHLRRISLAVGPAAAGEARTEVRAAILAWDLPADESVALLLTSELVTNAIKHGGGQAIV